MLNILARRADAAADVAALSYADQMELVRRAEAHHILPVVKARLATGSLPAALAARLKQAALETEAVNLGRLVQLETVLKGLHDAGIEVVALKGLHLALRVYPEAVQRTMGDFDLLVRPAEIPAAQRALANLGYRPSLETAVEMAMTLRRHIPPYLREHWPTVELHWSIVEPGHPFKVDMTGAWQRSEQTWVSGIPVRVFTPADLLLHLCLHAAYDHYLHMGLRPLADIQAVVEHESSGLDWMSLVRLAQEAGATRPTALMLRLVRDLLDVQVPETVFARLGAPDFDAELYQTIVDMLFSEHEAKPTITPDLAEVMQGTGPVQTVRRVLSRIFLSPQVMAMIYPVNPNSPRVLLYYPVRLGYLIRTYSRVLASRLRGDPETRRKAAEQTRRNEAEARLMHWLEDR